VALDWYWWHKHGYDTELNFARFLGRERGGRAEAGGADGGTGRV